MPGQCLWQVRGRKRLWLYPARAPFLPAPALQRIILGRTADTALHYEQAFDEHATVIDLEPGEMASWLRNWPPRVRNADCLNVSFTTEHWSDELRAGYANGLLRPLRRGRDLSREVRARRGAQAGAPAATAERAARGRLPRRPCRGRWLRRHRTTGPSPRHQGLR